MRSKWLLVGATLTGFAASTLVGCGDQSNTKVIDAPPVKPGETKPVPADVKQGGGKASSGHMNKNPGADS